LALIAHIENHRWLRTISKNIFLFDLFGFLMFNTPSQLNKKYLSLMFVSFTSLTTFEYFINHP